MLLDLGSDVRERLFFIQLSKYPQKTQKRIVWVTFQQLNFTLIVIQEAILTWC